MVILTLFEDGVQLFALDVASTSSLGFLLGGELCSGCSVTLDIYANQRKNKRKLNTAI